MTRERSLHKSRSISAFERAHKTMHLNRQRLLKLGLRAYTRMCVFQIAAQHAVDVFNMAICTNRACTHGGCPPSVVVLLLSVSAAISTGRPVRSNGWFDASKSTYPTSVEAFAWTWNNAGKTSQGTYKAKKIPPPTPQLRCRQEFWSKCMTWNNAGTRTIQPKMSCLYSNSNVEYGFRRWFWQSLTGKI